MLDTDLWNKIQAFDLDAPPAEYGFSIRLATEQNWTTHFTQAAIAEYKKFMYLAAVSEQMVSPSEVVDQVWHQHLVFSRSYRQFCALLGKFIEHIPSTHQPEEAEKFKEARAHTRSLYTSTFGEQPPQIWNLHNMYQPLRLAKHPVKISTFVAQGIVVFLALLWPIYALLKPVYAQMDSFYFLSVYLLVFIGALVILEDYTRRKLTRLVATWDRSSFVFHLTPQELIYLKNKDLDPVVLARVDDLIRRNAIEVQSDGMLKPVDNAAYQSIQEYSILRTLSRGYSAELKDLLMEWRTKPVFLSIANSMDAFSKYFVKSAFFGRLFTLNFVVCMFLWMVPLVRVMTGIAREKPIVIILVVTILAFIILVYYLVRTTDMLASKVLPLMYEQEILPAKAGQDLLAWQYFLMGTAAFSASFQPLVRRQESTLADGGGGGDGGSCGSSCGSGCGGCGGGD